jgi:DNA-binding MarR family transcriptional regulator
MNADRPKNQPTNAGCDNLLLDSQMCFALYSTSLLMTKVYKPLLQALGLTYPQYLTMMVLWEKDGLTVGEISTRLLTDPGSLTPLLKRLEVEGLLSRTRSRDDERVVIVQLTDQGLALREKATDVPNCILEATGHSSDQLQGLQQQLVKLRSQLQDNL